MNETENKQNQQSQKLVQTCTKSPREVKIEDIPGFRYGVSLTILICMR